MDVSDGAKVINNLKVKIEMEAGNRNDTCIIRFLVPGIYVP
jgi:hypothetical protein